MTRPDNGAACKVYIRWKPGYEPPESLAGWLSRLTWDEWDLILDPALPALEDKLSEIPPELIEWRNRINNVAAPVTD